MLSLLHERTTSYIGDPTGQELCLYLTQKACVPYMEILEKWVYKGIICDPYEEVSCFSVTVFACSTENSSMSCWHLFLMNLYILIEILLFFNNVGSSRAILSYCVKNNSPLKQCRLIYKNH